MFIHVFPMSKTGEAKRYDAPHFLKWGGHGPPAHRFLRYCIIKDVLNYEYQLTYINDIIVVKKCHGIFV